MIGGTDIYIPVAPGTPSLDCAIRAIRFFWPRAVFEDGQTAELYGRYEDIAFSSVREIMAYKDRDAFEHWRRLGAEPELDGTMLHLLASSRELTVVVDDRPSPQIRAMVECIQQYVVKYEKQFSTRTLREAA